MGSEAQADDVLAPNFDQILRSALMEDNQIDRIVDETGLHRARVYEMAEGSYHPRTCDRKAIERIIGESLTTTVRTA
jgi:hypothetical protein